MRSTLNIIYQKKYMKYILLAIGSLLAFSAGFSIAHYILDYGELSQYGKGYIWGKLFLFIAGLVLFYLGLRLWKQVER
jgi:FtsH-binding integral membrane protein